MDREKILAQREQSLDVRESLLTTTYYATMEKASAIAIKPAPPMMNDEELLAENLTLKAELYELRAEKRRGFRPSKLPRVSSTGTGKESSGGDENDKEVDSGSGSGSEEDDYSSDDCDEENGDGDGDGNTQRLEKKKKRKEKRKEANETIKVNRLQYEALLKTCAELEVRSNLF